MKNDKERDGFVGPVEKVIVERASFANQSGEWILGPRNLDSVTTYNRKGEKISESFGPNVLFGSELLSGHSEEKRDSSGNIIEHKRYDNDTLLYREVFTYEAEGRKVEEEIFNYEGVPSGKTRYKYDTHDKPVEMSKYDSNGMLTSKIVYANEYDPNGNLIKQEVERWTNVNGNLIHDPLFIIYYTITYY